MWTVQFICLMRPTESDNQIWSYALPPYQKDHGKVFGCPLRNVDTIEDILFRVVFLDFKLLNQAYPSFSPRAPAIRHPWWKTSSQIINWHFRTSGQISRSKALQIQLEGHLKLWIRISSGPLPFDGEYQQSSPFPFCTITSRAKAFIYEMTISAVKKILVICVAEPLCCQTWETF